MRLPSWRDVVAQVLTRRLGIGKGVVADAYFEVLVEPMVNSGAGWTDGQGCSESNLSLA